MKKKLYKSRKNRIIGGVCAGLADYFNVDPTIVRVISVLLGCLKGTGLLIYLVLWIIMPYNENEDMYEDDEVENLKSANINDEDKKSSSKNKERNSSKKEGMHSDQEFNDYFQKCRRRPPRLPLRVKSRMRQKVLRLRTSTPRQPQAP